ncbi:hypothetical protein E1218_07620 [Kribbella turkmenica]|uniref:Uncharacterized protein n=1 Tax=Kribbella turkmenica TaxID=2530375 RepID=A0A4R4XC41_9ACTN|nr:hypothetical protein [Kribbella turkmenica]TDD28256.1 hypothetical protein E1218_07620 [Kribbella turkmenica]
MRRTAVAVVVLAVLVAGCQDTPDGNGTPSPTITETTGEPSPEPTTLETTGTRIDEPSIEIANAPIGGNVEEDGVEQCAEVNWLGKNPIPGGTTISLGSVRLSAQGVFELYQGSCPGDVRACADVRWQSGDFKPCYVGARQVANGTEDVYLVIGMTAVCETQDDCDGLVEGFGESQIRFRPMFLETPTTEPTSEGTPSSEMPSDG